MIRKQKGVMGGWIDKTFVIFKGVHIQEHPLAWGRGKGQTRGGEVPVAAPQVITDLAVALAAAPGACWGRNVVCKIITIVLLLLLRRIRKVELCLFKVVRGLPATWRCTRLRPLIPFGPGR